MNYTFVNKPSVNKDIIEIVDYYKTISPKLALAFLFRLREVKKHILKSPLGFQLKYKNVRTILLKQFPYQFHYIINDESKQIIVIAIIHSYRKPKNYLESD